jgi:hypothetical protein
MDLLMHSLVDTLLGGPRDRTASRPEEEEAPDRAEAASDETDDEATYAERLAELRTEYRQRLREVEEEYRRAIEALYAMFGGRRGRASPRGTTVITIETLDRGPASMTSPGPRPGLESVC